MAKKTFTDRIQQKAVNPTMQFISAPEEAYTEPQAVPEKPARRRPAPTPSTPRKAAPARRAQPLFDEETKSRRLQLLLTPSLYEAIKERASKERVSVNELVNTLLRDALRK